MSKFAIYVCIVGKDGITSMVYLVVSLQRFILGFIGMLPGLLYNLLVRQDSNMEDKTGTWERFNVSFS